MKKFIRISKLIRDCWSWNPKWWLRQRVRWYVDKGYDVPEPLPPMPQ